MAAKLMLRPSVVLYGTAYRKYHGSLGVDRSYTGGEGDAMDEVITTGESLRSSHTRDDMYV